eukprot:jgi/Tetstr1/444685/TSEL_032533.t1
MRAREAKHRQQLEDLAKIKERFLARTKEIYGKDLLVLDEMQRRGAVPPDAPQAGPAGARKPAGGRGGRGARGRGRAAAGAGRGDPPRSPGEGKPAAKAPPPPRSQNAPASNGWVPQPDAAPPPLPPPPRAPKPAERPASGVARAGAGAKAPAAAPAPTAPDNRAAVHAAEEKVGNLELELEDCKEQEMMTPGDPDVEAEVMAAASKLQAARDHLARLRGSK